MATKQTVLSVRLQRTEMLQLEAIAKDEDRAKSAVARRFIREALAERKNGKARK